MRLKILPRCKVYDFFTLDGRGVEVGGGSMYLSFWLVTMIPFHKMQP